MSSIGSLSSSYAGPSYSCTSSSSSSGRAQRSDPSEMQRKLFDKLDSDSSGNVDATELQSALDALAKSQGGDASTVSATDLLAKLDTDGSGGLSETEFSSAVDASRPPPPDGGRGGPPPMSTADFARSRSGSTDGTDPLMALDSDQDGAVSRAEFGIAGTDGDDSRMKAFFDAVDANGDGSITGAEASSFKEQLEARFQQEGSGGGPAQDPGQGGMGASSSGSGDWDGRSLSVLAMLAQAHYGAVGGAEGTASSSAGLALAA